MDPTTVRTASLLRPLAAQLLLSIVWTVLGRPVEVEASFLVDPNAGIAVQSTANSAHSAGDSSGVYGNNDLTARFVW